MTTPEPLDALPGRGYTVAAGGLAGVAGVFWGAAALSGLDVRWAGRLVELVGAGGQALLGFVFPPAALMFGLAALVTGERGFLTMAATTVAALLTVGLVVTL